MKPSKTAARATRFAQNFQYHTRTPRPLEHSKSFSNARSKPLLLVAPTVVKLARRTRQRRNRTKMTHCRSACFSSAGLPSFVWDTGVGGEDTNFRRSHWLARHKSVLDQTRLHVGIYLAIESEELVVGGNGQRCIGC